jgi:DNA polymerase III subunit epsilon
VKYCVLDIETTGLDARVDRITEITAIQLIDGRKHNELHLTFNPEAAIPKHISVLTGIRDEALKDAPTFAEQAQKLYAFLEGQIIVAHQAHFDVHFLKSAFKQVGIHYQPKSLCTLKLSRKMLPGLRGFTLAHLCQYLGIQNQQPHRSWGDAHATVKIFQGLLGLGAMPLIKKELSKNTASENIPINVATNTWLNMPMSTGVYYLLNREKKIIYIGKALNISKRVSQHFRGNTARAVQLRNDVHDIQWTETGSYMLATLLEDVEIRKHWPSWNLAQKNAQIWHGVIHYQDQLGRHRLKAGRVRNPNLALVRFTNVGQCREWLWQVCKAYQLNPEWCGLPASEFTGTHLHEQGITQLLQDLKTENTGFACISKGPEPDKQSVIVFYQNELHFGLIQTGRTTFMLSELEMYNIIGAERPAVRSLIGSYLSGLLEPFDKIPYETTVASEN